MTLLADSQIEALRDEVCALLAEVGMKVENEEIRGLLKARGGTLAPDGRVRIPRSLIDEFVRHQEARRGAPSPPPAKETKRSPALMGCAFGPGPTRYFDYDTRQTRPVDTPIFTAMMQFADATPEIGRVHPWFRQDTHPPIMAVESLVLGLKLTRKVTGLDAINPREVKYLVEISEIVTGRPGDASYLAGSQCITPPLVLGHRSAQEMLERARHGVRSYYVATMTLVGASAPVDLERATVLGTAEVLGGLIAAYVVQPEANLTGTAATTVLDMASGSGALNAPETALLDQAVKELFDRAFGGHVTAHIRYAPNAKVPGLQAVFENFWGALAVGLLAGGPLTYSGNGNLDLGGVGSPVQAMLDVEVLRSLAPLHADTVPCEEPLPFSDLCEIVRTGGRFLTADHTLRHFRRLWSPQFFRREQLGPAWDGSEQAILDRCHAQWQANRSRYEPPSWDDDILRALDDVVERARRELL